MLRKGRFDEIFFVGLPTQEERKAIFTPILDCLSDVPRAQRAGMRVLVPGCGLGRLAWEISELG